MLSIKLTAAFFPALLACCCASASDRPVRIDPKGCPKPEIAARQLDEADAPSVTVSYLVSADGKVLQSKVLESSGSSSLDRVASHAGEHCNFDVATRDGQAAPGWAKVRYLWVVD